MTYSTVDCADATCRGKPARPFWRFTAAVLADIRRGLAIRKVRRQLYTLPDYMLKDLGISRCDSEYLAAHGESAVRLVSGRAPADTPSV
jgi:uncharacterized protein YjiS (DUF1127 family)